MPSTPPPTPTRHDSTHKVLLCDPSKPSQRVWRARLLARLATADIANAASNGTANGWVRTRVHFLPRISPVEFLELCRESTIVLDPFPVSPQF